MKLHQIIPSIFLSLYTAVSTVYLATYQHILESCKIHEHIDHTLLRHNYLYKDIEHHLLHTVHLVYRLRYIDTLQE